MSDAPTVLREFHRPGLWLVGWVALFALVAVGSLLPPDNLPPLRPGLDKLQHFIGYALLSAYAVMLFERMRPQALAALTVVAFGIAIELAQGAWTTSRVADSADAMANALGALAGLLVAPTPAARWLQWLDARWTPRAVERPGGERPERPDSAKNAARLRTVPR